MKSSKMTKATTITNDNLASQMVTDDEASATITNANNTLVLKVRRMVQPPRSDFRNVFLH